MNEDIIKALAVEMRGYVDQRIAEIPHGPAGPAGAPGERGPQGEKGITGERGTEGIPGPAGRDGAPGPQGIVGPQGERGPEGVPGRDGRDAIPMPGPQGERGEKGIDGRDGKDGRDGITVEQMKSALAIEIAAMEERIVKSITYDLETREFKIGDRALAKFHPPPVYREVYRAGETYQRGELVTFGGSVWHCNAASTTEKPGTNGDWTLAVKHGRDGRDR